jgi:PAS domain S-box-containing protein
MRLRDRLVVRVLWVFVPLVAALIGMAAWHHHVRATDARTAAAAEQTAVAAALAARIDERVQGARGLLTALSAIVSSDARGASETMRTLRDVLARSSPAYRTLWVADRDGVIRAHAGVTDLRGVRIADRWYFREAMRTRDFVISPGIKGRGGRANAWGVVFAMPLRDGSGIVALSMTAESIAGMLDVPLPWGSNVTVVDSTMRILTRTVDPRRFVGIIAPQTDATRRAWRGEVTSVDGVSPIDGVRRLSTVRRVGSAPWLVAVGVPMDAALQAVDRQARVERVVVLTTVLLALVCAWFLARRVTQPVERLTHAVLERAHDGAWAPGAMGRGEVGILAEAFDELVTQVDARERAIAATAARYQQLFDRSPLPILEWDLASQRIVAANAAAVSTYGHARDALVGRPVDLVLDPREVSLVQQERTATASTLPAARAAVHRHASGRAIEVESYATIIEGDGAASVLHAALDLTARRQSERALEESRAQLRQAQKLESLGAFAGGIAHDFNNHLSAILGVCELALMRPALDASVRGDLALVQRSAQTAATLTRQLLVFAQRQSITIAPLSLATVLRDAVPELERLLGGQHRLEVEIADAVPAARGDASQVMQILQNLVANARDAMPAGGTVRLALSETESAGEGRVLLRVQDSGAGMPRDVLSRAFEPFFTTKPRSRGTGLGLSIVYGIVQRFGGTLDIDSVVGVGTTVTIALPAVPEPVLAITPGQGTAVGPLATARGEVVLLVDDDTAVREMTTAMLVRLGYQVVSAVDARDAVEVAATLDRPIDVLVTDMVMPGRSGRDLADELRATRPTVRVLFMSGYTDDDAFQAGVAAEDAAYLHKPFTIHALADRLRRLLDAPPVARAA